MKRILWLIMIVVAFSFAQEETETYIRNICDTLPNSATPLVELKMAYVDVGQWYGSKDLSKKDSSSVKRYKSYESIKPFRDKKISLSLPYSITASCAETQYNLYKIAQWNESSLSWDLNADNDDYATYIMDANMVEFPGYNVSNSYNILAFRKGSLPQDGSYKAEDLMVSRTFEFQFDWWYTYTAYTVVSTTSIKWKMTASYGLDSLSSLTNALKSLDIPDSISKIQIHQFHVVLTDPNKKEVASSSSAMSSSSVASSSSEAASSSSVASSTSEASSSSKESSSSSKGSSSSIASSSSKAKSSSSEASSASEKKSSSSSKKTTAIDRLVSMPRVFEAREVRRLDGSLVKVGEQLMPGVYYVKGVDGRWKKQVELP